MSRTLSALSALPCRTPSRYTARLPVRQACGTVDGVGAMAWKVMGLGSAILAGVAARKVLTTAWRKGTGEDPPANPESPDTTWGQAIAWALASGAAIGLARMLATRKAADYYRKSSGHLPPGLEEVQ